MTTLTTYFARCLACWLVVGLGHLATLVAADSGTSLPVSTSTFTPREAIIEVVNRLFYYTDILAWDALKEQVFTTTVSFAAGPIQDHIDAVDLTSQEIVDQWNAGLANIEHVIHLAGNYIVTMDNNNTNEEEEAIVTCYAKATHYNNTLTRDFVGSYELGMIYTSDGWKMNAFRYNLMYTLGSLTPVTEDELNGLSMSSATATTAEEQMTSKADDHGGKQLVRNAFVPALVSMFLGEVGMAVMS